MGCCLWGRTESDSTEAAEQQQQQQELLKPVLPGACAPQQEKPRIEKPALLN